MYLCASTRASFIQATRVSEELLPCSCLPSVLQLLSERHRMQLMKGVRRACAALSFPGRLFLIYLLLDTFYLACVYEPALLPSSFESDNVSDSVNASTSSSSSSTSSSSRSLSSQAIPPPAAALLPSSSASLSSSSSSLLVGDKRNVNSSFNDTDSSDSSRNGSKHAQGENSGSSSKNGTSNSSSNNQQVVSTHHAGKPKKEFPLALVVAASTAAVSILLFFLLSYIWHTRQLDHRAQKLAIRLAAEADSNINKCSQCRPPSAYLATRSISQDSPSESDNDDEEEESCVLPPPPPARLDELNSLNEEDEEAEVGEDGSRRKAGGVGRTLGSRRGSRSRVRRSGSRSSRKMSGHSGGQNRSSLVTDQEILSHFASRRHSTFFI
ncbi:uncharacterized protein [Littorina saxatilis]|uniref:Transmembrane protein n=1 Tax=Littorina saxatilis TaxID=31220 RepID=A0AAN9G6M3_9CAEN